MTDQVAQIPGWNVLLEGDSGSGKTTALRTIVEECGLELFVIFTEPGMDMLADLPSDKCHWAYIPPTTESFETMLKQAQTLNKMSWDMISKQTADPDKKKYDAYVRLLMTLANFKDDRTGEVYGAVDSWGPDRCIAVDSLSGLNRICMQFITGGSLAKTQPQWGASMNAELGLIDNLCLQTRCHFVLTSHLDKTLDTVNGGMWVQPNALGQKNAPEIPKNFSDVILQVGNSGKYRWSTLQAQTVVKHRNVPLSDKLEPSFKLLHENWKKRAYLTDAKVATA